MATVKTQKQGGLTLISFIFVLAFVIFVSYIGMKIGPIYMEYYSVVSAMNGVASERGSANLSPYDVRVKVLNRLYVSYSAENVKEKHIKLTRNNGVNLRIAYEVRKPVIGNLDVVAKFDRSVRLAN
ncbi:MAG: DUF4845 domain-containing protein [Xanthomonadales bacterium]|nr:DUF4845 domain-containing protein [Gammaproteobacteria bacterium]MBT8073138.1 DUF4845 domain-containing protein [Gammaproteobacteria bacterium]MBT8075579.1 DUF4845 domain-containing protein [Gammaproteobacteria bacterium]NNK03982.1 DUF4845 domain-containing protein [Xanthomonadales bacterium]NNL00322.1 DUF4845 domain-containing protein [Xanthomonadales bacterium]